MLSMNKKVMVPIIIFLFVTLISGGIILAVKLISNTPREIIIRQASTSSDNVLVNISGAVLNPGIYPLKNDDTFDSLITAAALKPDANPLSISIYVHSNTERIEPQKINLNTAEAWLLEALPDIGQTRAEAIIAYRQQNGVFKTLNELLNVQGIGESTLDKIKDKITVEN
jgi:competence protein ComEA